jgi:hypothetical protein
MMLIRLSDSPFPAFSQPPKPQQPQLPPVQPPMVYVFEQQAWEYKIVVKNVTAEELPSEQELNALGVSGWELTGVVTLPGKVQFYFKRFRK